jgi:hypothetical protein
MVQIPTIAGRYSYHLSLLWRLASVKYYSFSLIPLKYNWSLISFILFPQYFLVVKGIRRAIHADIANGKVDDWEQRYGDLVGSRDPVEQKGSAPRNRKA